MANTFYLPKNDPDLDRDYIRGSEYMDGTRTAIRTISSDFDTKVVFEGEGAATNGDYVIMPMQDQDAMMTHRQVNVGRGYANHESLHKLLTDFVVGAKWLTEMAKTGRHFTASMGQAIEDIRIESGGCKLYPGMPKSIDKTAEEVCRHFAENHKSDIEGGILNDPWKMLPLAVTWIGRIKLGYPSEVIRTAFDQLGEDVKRRATLVADAVLNGIEHGVEGVGQVNKSLAHKGFAQGIKLAERVADELAKELPPEKPDGPGKGKTKGTGADTGTRKGEGTGEDGDDADGDGPGDGGSGDQDKGDGDDADDAVEKTQHGENEASEGGKASKTKGDGSDTIGHGASEADRETALTPEPTPMDHDLNIVKELLSNHTMSKETGRAVKQTVHKVPFTTADDVIGIPKHALKNAAHYRKEYHAAKKVLGSRVATMRRKLERALIAKVTCDYETGISGRLNVRSKAPNIIMGSDHIYRRRIEGDEIDTAVTLLVDCSGSMQGEPMKLAGHSAIALAEALESGNVPYEVIGHTTMSLSGESWERLRNIKTVYDEEGKCIAMTGYARECAIYMPVFKPFDKALRQCYHTMGMIPTSADGANADACALREAGDRLLKRHESKKVLLLLADGYPAWSTSFNTKDRDAYTRDAVANLEARGITCVGIGIASDCVKRYFPKWVIINSIDDLSKTVLDQIAKMIIGERFTVDNASLIGGGYGSRAKAS